MIKKIEDYVKSKKIDKYEIFFNKNKNLQIDAPKGKIEFCSSGETEGFGIRIVNKNKLGFASTTNLEEYKKCIDNAIEIAKTNNTDSKFKDFIKSAKYRKVKCNNEKINNLSEKKATKMIKEYLEGVKSENPKIKISENIYSWGESKIIIINSNGISCEKTKASQNISIELINKNTSYWLEHNLVNTFGKKEGIEDAKYLLSLEKKEQTQTGEFPVILHPETISALIEKSFGYNIDQENINLKNSILHNKINQKIFNQKITIEDNALEPMMLSSRPFDDEGTPSQKITLIKNGIFKTGITDSYNALHINKKLTGHASRGASSTPFITPTNMIMHPGNTSLKKLISSIKYGAIIRTLSGIHTMDEKTGSFSQGIQEGHIIENGKITKAINDSMIAGNLYEALSQEIILSKERKITDNYKTPYILVPKLKLIGK